MGKFLINGLIGSYETFFYCRLNVHTESSSDREWFFCKALIFVTSRTPWAHRLFAYTVAGGLKNNKKVKRQQNALQSSGWSLFVCLLLWDIPLNKSSHLIHWEYKNTDIVHHQSPVCLYHSVNLPLSRAPLSSVQMPPQVAPKWSALPVLIWQSGGVCVWKYQTTHRFHLWCDATRPNLFMFST